MSFFTHNIPQPTKHMVIPYRLICQCKRTCGMCISSAWYNFKIIIMPLCHTNRTNKLCSRCACYRRINISHQRRSVIPCPTGAHADSFQNHPLSPAIFVPRMTHFRNATELLYRIRYKNCKQRTPFDFLPAPRLLGLMRPNPPAVLTHLKISIRMITKSNGSTQITQQDIPSHQMCMSHN